MDKSNAEWILDSLMGNLEEKYCCADVENLFAEGKPCAQLYRQMLDAYRRLCNRLGQVDEDEDCEIMINALLDILRIVSMKMFDYGVSAGEE